MRLLLDLFALLFGRHCLAMLSFELASESILDPIQSIDDVLHYESCLEIGLLRFEVQGLEDLEPGSQVRPQVLDDGVVGCVPAQQLGLLLRFPVRVFLLGLLEGREVGLRLRLSGRVGCVTLRRGSLLISAGVHGGVR